MYDFQIGRLNMFLQISIDALMDNKKILIFDFSMDSQIMCNLILKIALY